MQDLSAIKKISNILDKCDTKTAERVLNFVADAYYQKLQARRADDAARSFAEAEARMRAAVKNVPATAADHG